MLKKMLLCSMLISSFNFVHASENQIDPHHQIIIQHIENAIALRKALETIVHGIRDIYSIQSNFTEYAELQELELQAEPLTSEIQTMTVQLQAWRETLSNRDLYKLSAETYQSYDSIATQLQNAHSLLDLLHEK
ncbi:MAG: hypothetical protein NTZ68_03375 [Candidatus Dependentiae bacterium]|nr:hypothetical protein [Candidatus Dependentiae bacterium]